jgi:stage II sporulation protein D
MLRQLMRILLTVLSLLHFQSGFAGLTDIFSYKKNQEIPTVKVLLLEDVDGALLEVKGRGYKIYDPENNGRLGNRFFGKAFYVHPLKNGLKWGEFFPQTYQIMLVPDDDSTTFLVDGKEYQGTIFVYQSNNKIHIVNELSVESYVKSILGSKVSSAYSEEALAALAITARTETVYQKLKQKGAFWHIRAQGEGYQGYSVTHRPFGIDEAVDHTKGMVLHSGQAGLSEPFLAKWTEDSAGKTATLMTVFKNSARVPYFSIDTPFAAMNRENSSWNFSIDADDFAKMVGLKYLNNVETYLDPESGKIYALRVFNQEISKDVEMSKLRRILGASGLKSNDFTVKFNDGVVSFSGHGSGDSVGLCLFSADVMAKQGMNAKKILGHFFPNTQLNLVQGEPVAKNIRKIKTKASSSAGSSFLE